MARPKLVAFDLDYTLWPFWVDTHVDPPFKLKNGKVVDNRGKKVEHYPEVPQILEQLHSEGYILTVASRTGEIRGANQLVQLFGWDKYFTQMEIYPGCKKKHFEKFHKKTGIPYKDMLFFDDEMRNIHDINSIGATAIFVEEGMDTRYLHKGFDEFARRNSGV